MRNLIALVLISIVALIVCSVVAGEGNKKFQSQHAVYVRIPPYVSSGIFAEDGEEETAKAINAWIEKNPGKEIASFQINEFHTTKFFGVWIVYKDAR